MLIFFRDALMPMLLQALRHACFRHYTRMTALLPSSPRRQYRPSVRPPLFSIAATLLAFRATFVEIYTPDMPALFLAYYCCLTRFSSYFARRF